MLSKEEQELQGDRYWIEDLIQGSVDFLKKGDAFGEDLFVPNTQVCQLLDVSTAEPCFDLFLPANRGISLRFDYDGSRVLDAAKQQSFVDAPTFYLGPVDGQIQIGDLALVDDGMVQE
mmetsp:Transcript_2815/g.5875  ORF Transcript_2815/g.5875 Transcript_2815/m.5875 type:complete len:118 (-) Transcript_2815:208-561(-)|eukprot:scaffold8306_cov171-Amphora_coffeaeformis.AAC.8